MALMCLNRHNLDNVFVLPNPRQYSGTMVNPRVLLCVFFRWGGVSKASLSLPIWWTRLFAYIFSWVIKRFAINCFFYPFSKQLLCLSLFFSGLSMYVSY
jgi:hypothetical protein